MSKFYCRAEPGVWDYRRAKSSELALACFLQDKGLSESHEGAFATTVDHLLVSRLLEYIPEEFDPWGCETPFTLDCVSEVDPKYLDEDGDHTTAHDELMANVKNRTWHAERIMWLVKNPKLLEDPISVDNHCVYSRILPVPVIVDGWHRFFAYRFMGIEKIPALYSGRVDLKNYLRGRGKRPVE